MTYEFIYDPKKKMCVLVVEGVNSYRSNANTTDGSAQVGPVPLEHSHWQL